MTELPSDVMMLCAAICRSTVIGSKSDWEVSVSSITRFKINFGNSYRLSFFLRDIMHTATEAIAMAVVSGHSPRFIVMIAAAAMTVA